MPNKFSITALVGLSESQLLSIRTKAVNMLLSDDLGGQITSVSTRDLSTNMLPGASPNELLAAVEYALWKLDPATYAKPDSAKFRKKWLV